MKAREKVQICKLAAQVILSDGQVTDTEHDFLDRIMKRYGLSDQERREVTRRNIDDDPAEMAKEIKGFEARSELLQEIAEAVLIDGTLSPTERDALARIGTAIGSNAEEIDSILMAMKA